MFTLLTCIATMGLQSPSPPNVDFRCDAMPAYKALALLSSLYGQPLLTSRQTANETLLIAVHGVRRKDLLDQIAYVVDGSWKKERGGLRLVRSQQQLNHERRAAQELFRKRVSTALAETPAVLQAIEPLDPKEQDKSRPTQKPHIYPLDVHSPADHFLATALLTIGPAAISKIEPNSRVVFSTRPTALQLPLPYNAFPRYLSECETNKSPTSESPWIDRKTGKPLRPSRAELVLAREPEEDNLTARLNFVDSNGRAIDTCYWALVSHYYDQDAPEKAPLQGDACAWSPKLLEFQAQLKRARKELPVEASFKARVLHPEDVDPLSITASEMVFTASRPLGSQIVACLPDSTALSPTESVCSRSHCKSALEQAGVRFDCSGHWVRVLPTDPIQARTQRLDRKALGHLLRESEAKHVLTLDAFSSLIRASGAEPQSSLLRFALAFTHREQFEPVFVRMSEFLSTTLESPEVELNEDDWDALRFFQSLSRNQRQLLWDRGALHIDSLGENSKRLLNRMIFHKGRPLVVVAYPSGEMEDDSDQYVRESTGVLPQGIPENAYISSTVTDSTIAVPVGYPKGDHLLSPDARFFKVVRRNLYLTFQLTPTLECGVTFDDDIVDTSKVRRLSEFPKKFQDEIKSVHRKSSP